MFSGARLSPLDHDGNEGTLDAFRLGDEESFRKDQPKESIAIIDDLLGVLALLLSEAKVANPENKARNILRRTHVWMRTPLNRQSRRERVY
jgi:hypothetical protein